MAAGLGFKTFTTGEVLTAADVNGYLMQGINVFASSAARAAAITSPQEGQYSFLKDTNALEYYDGAAWVGAPVGDITAVTAGKGLTGGGSSGDVTVSLGTTAKGDLVAGSGASTAAVLTVGANGETLVADSSTSTGLRYNPNYTAGKNFVINGGFDIWQRGTSFSTTNGGNAYNADRWTYYGGGTGTITQSTALLRDGAQYALRFTSTSASGNADIYQIMETPNTVQLQGKVITVSVYVAGTVGKTANVFLGSSTVDNDGLFGTYTSLTASGTSSVTTTGSYQRITAQFTIPSTARTLRLGLSHSALASTEFISWAQVQLEVGSTATNFSRAGGTIQGELAACQRYYWRTNVATNQPVATTGVCVTAAIADSTVIFPQTMRIAPTAIEYATIQWYNAGNGSLYSSGTWSISSGSTLQWLTLRYTHGSNVLTQGQAGLVISSGSSGYIGFSAEL